MKKSLCYLFVVCLLISFAFCTNVFAQRVRLPAPSTSNDFVPTTVSDLSTPGSGTLAPVAQVGTGTATYSVGPTLGTPTFDPYASQLEMTVDGPPVGTPAAGQSFGSTTLPPPPEVYGQPGVQAFPGSPPVLFPQGNELWGPGAASGPASWGPPLRLIYGPRFRWTWLPGDAVTDNMQWHDFDVSVAVAFPNFLYSSQPIFVLPSFGLNLWSGPTGAGVDLPERSYEAFIDVGWQSDPNKILSVDLGGRVGVFTDFDTLTDDSWRFLGKLLLRYRFSPKVQVRGGVIYVDRNKTELIPAGGILWEPHDHARLDIYFPEPKAGFYLTTLGNSEFWWYVAGEWGGGSWTVQRTAGGTDSIDLNDIRLIGGIEWGRPELIRQGRRIGFIEAGWVNSRELLYFGNAPGTPNSVKFDDTIMLRAGIGY